MVCVRGGDIFPKFMEVIIIHNKEINRDIQVYVYYILGDIWFL